MTDWRDGQRPLRSGSKPFLSEPDASVGVARTTGTKHLTVVVCVREAMKSREWMTVKEVAAASGVHWYIVCSTLQYALRNGSAEKEYNVRPRGVRQRYRLCVRSVNQKLESQL